MNEAGRNEQHGGCERDRGRERWPEGGRENFRMAKETKERRGGEQLAVREGRDVKGPGEGTGAQGPAGRRLPQEGEEPRVRGQVGIDGERQEGGAHQVHRLRSGKVQLHSVLGLRGCN